MVLKFILLVVSLMTCLCVHHLSSCDCADKPVFTPSRLVVKHGDPTSAKCRVCEQDCHNNLFNLEKSLGSLTSNGTTLEWNVDRMTEWDTSATCFYNKDNGDQCCSILHVTVYQPPENVSISFVNHTEPMFECGQYTLQCAVQKVAPIENLIVTFYRGKTALGHLQSNSKPQKKPVSEIFTLSFNTSKEDDGAQYWCEAKLELGPEGPQPPPVVMSEKLTATVYCLESASTTLLPTTTPSAATTTAMTTATTAMTTVTTATTATTATTTTTTTKTSTKPNSTSSLSVHSFIMCFMLLFPALV